MIPRLKDNYEKKIIGDLQKKFSMKSKYMVPKFVKVILNNLYKLSIYLFNRPRFKSRPKPFKGSSSPTSLYFCLCIALPAYLNVIVLFQS